MVLIETIEARATPEEKVYSHSLSEFLLSAIEKPKFIKRLATNGQSLFFLEVIIPSKFTFQGHIFIVYFHYRVNVKPVATHNRNL